MRLPLAAVVHLFQFRHDARSSARCLALLVAVVSVGYIQVSDAEPAVSQSGFAQQTVAGKAYIAQIELHTAAELHSALKRADQLFEGGDFVAGNPPVQFVLHGAEAKVLQQNQYQQNKALVDLAARLSAFEVVEIRVCETWMHGQKIDPTTLPPFIGTVANGPKEKQRLMQSQGYTYF